MKKWEEMVVIADAQTAGRGRLGRSFMSNHASGIYMSILLKPTFSLEYAKKLTCLAAAATLFSNRSNGRYKNNQQMGQ